MKREWDNCNENDVVTTKAETRLVTTEPPTYDNGHASLEECHDDIGSADALKHIQHKNATVKHEWIL